VRQGCLIVLACACVLLAAPALARAQGVDQTCSLALTRTDPATVNVAFPDEAAVYYSSGYQAVPGTRIRIQGAYPHARYVSFNVYDAAQRPLDALADVQLAPDAGSSNPFLTGAARGADPRKYTGFIDFGPTPERRAPNTLYTGTGQNGAPNYGGTFIYRIYIPDNGRDQSGGVGLPTVTLESTDGGPAPESACASFQKPPGPGVNDQVAASNGLPAPSPAEAPGASPPTWHKFVNLPRSAADELLGNPYGDPARQPTDSIPLDSLGGNGGFLSNVHNAYLATAINTHYGPVVATRMRAPTFPDTRSGAPVMPGGQLRYFSMCQNEFASQRFIACRTDDQTAVDPDGFMTYVVSAPAQRPANARPECGITWLPWGPSAEGNLIYRHMLPDPGFAQAIQRVPSRGKEQAVMGDYFPQSRYYGSAHDFEAVGCHSRRSAGYVAPPRLRVSVRPARVRTGERRRFRIRVTSGKHSVRSATVRFAGKRVRTRRRGRAAVVTTLRRSGRYRLRATRHGYRAGRASVRAVRRG
jgi:hypothetical protein